MRAILDDATLDERFRSEDKLEKVHTEQRRVEFKYGWAADNGYFYVFKDCEGLEEWNLPRRFVHGMIRDADGEYLWFADKGQADFFIENYRHSPSAKMMMNFYDEEPVGVELPESVVAEIMETGVTTAKGKGATIETGYFVLVPPSVNVGDKIRVNTDTGEYVERVKN